jgi:hypothetical protein
MTSNGGRNRILDTQCLIMSDNDERSMDGVMWSITTIGGGTSIRMTILFKERTFQITTTGAGEHGEMSIGGGTEKLESSMIRSTSLQRGTLDGGTDCLTTKTYPLTIWTCPHLG